MAQAPSSFEVEVVAPKDLRACEATAWRVIQQSRPEFANPLFGPDFSRLVGRVRADARIAVFLRRGEPVAFLPFHQRGGGLGRPIGAPFSDYQALVSKRDAGLAGRDALKLAGLRAFRFNGLVDPEGAFERTVAQGEAYAIALDGSPEAFLEEVRAASPKKFKNYRRLEHRLEREVGPLRLVADDRSPEAFRQLIDWKRDQFRRTGLQDVLRPEWASKLMRTLFETRAGDSRGLMMSLYAGDVLVAGHFGARSQSVYHPWIASANPELTAYSPGQMFLGHAVRAMPELGLSIYDLGPGHDHYKRPYANVVRTMGAGLFTTGGVSGALAGAGETVLAATGISRIPAVDKVLRRLDHIRAIDPTAAGFVRGLGEAAAGLGKRGLGNDALSEAVA